MIISDLFSSKDACPVCGQTPCNCTQIAESVAEADKHSFVGKIQRHHELKKKVDQTWKDASDAEKRGDNKGADRAFNKHVRYANLERPGTWTTVKEQGVAEASIPYALSAANANAEYRRQGAAGGGYRGRIDIPVQSREDYISAGRALKKAAAAAGQKIEYGLSNGVMSVFSDSMDADTLDQFIDSVLDQGVAEGYDDKSAGQAIQKLQSFAKMNPDFTLSDLERLPSHGMSIKQVLRNAVQACDALKQQYLANKQAGNAQFIDNLKSEIKWFMTDRTQSQDPATLGELLQGTLGKINFQKGVAEQQINEISPYDYDSDADYYDALRAAKRRAQGRSADDYDDYEDEPMDNNDDDESYYEKYVRTKGLEEVEDQKPESLTYKDLFKQPEPGQETEPKDELHLHNWDEYWKLRNEKQPQQQKDVAEGDKKPEPPEADYGDEYQDMVGRLKKLAGMGPLKPVYDPKRRVYRNMPTAVQPPKK